LPPWWSRPTRFYRNCRKSPRGVSISVAAIHPLWESSPHTELRRSRRPRADIQTVRKLFSQVGEHIRACAWRAAPEGAGPRSICLIAANVVSSFRSVSGLFERITQWPSSVVDPQGDRPQTPMHHDRGNVLRRRISIARLQLQHRVLKEDREAVKIARTRFDSESFFVALDAERVAKGVTWHQAAQATGVSVSTLTRTSQGTRLDANGLMAPGALACLDSITFLQGDGGTVNELGNACGRESQTKILYAPAKRSEPVTRDSSRYWQTGQGYIRSAETKVSEGCALPILHGRWEPL